MKIGFNKPYFTGKEVEYIIDAVAREKISGNGYFTGRCQSFLEKRYGIPRVLLTSSCTDALEMCALLLDIKPGDEVIVPSFTFVSTANAFILRGAKIVFADSSPENPNLDLSKLESLITVRTRAIVIVHYAGVSCDMDMLMDIANKHKLFVVEDAAQAIESTYNGKALGTIGHLGCFSFHETKNVISGEGGALLVNHKEFVSRAEVLWEKGTNRTAFSRGEVNKYNWLDVGSSFLPSDVTAALLFAQLENIDSIQKRRHYIWKRYYDELQILQTQNKVRLPHIPERCVHNAHLFYLVCRDATERDEFIVWLNENGVNAIFHYLSLHKSPYFSPQYNGAELTQSDAYTSQLIRLPLFYELKEEEITYIIKTVIAFFNGKA